jgi:methyl-accepting chemotaxis protein
MRIFRRDFPVSLSLRISAAVAILVFILGASTGIYNFFHDRQVYLSDFEHHTLETTQVLARTMAEAVLLRDFNVLRASVNKMVESEIDARYALIEDEDGTVLASTDHTQEGKDLKDPVSRQATASKKALVQQARFKDEPVFDVVVPLEIEGSRWGMVRVGYSLQEIYRRLSFDLIRNITLAFLALLFGFTYSLVRSRALTRPLRALTDHITSSSSQLLSVSRQIASGATEQAASVNQTTATLEELGAAAKQIADNASYTAQATEHALTSVQAGEQVVKNTIDLMDEIKGKTENTARDIVALGEKSQQIGSVMEIIDDIAEQTNLLALNASIEAARAGEAGKGFAVVASEIRKLAENVADSTSEVKELITELQSSTSRAVMATEEGIKTVDEGTHLAGKTGETIKNIMSVISMTTDSAKQISLATQQQQSASEQSITVIREIDKLAEQSAAASRELASSAAELDRLTADLRQVLGGKVN